jgi:hypothetical protein
MHVYPSENRTSTTAVEPSNPTLVAAPTLCTAPALLVLQAPVADTDDKVERRLAPKFIAHDGL